MRSSLTETLHEDYMTTARAVGLSPRRAVLRHAVPNALLPVIALTAMSLGYVVGGVIFIESVFSWPGIGQLTYDALTNRDLPVLQGVFLLSSRRGDPHEPARRPAHLALDPRVRRADAGLVGDRRRACSATSAARSRAGRSRGGARRALRRPPAARGVRAGRDRARRADGDLRPAARAAGSARDRAASTSRTACRDRRRTGSAPTRRAATCSRSSCSARASRSSSASRPASRRR